MPYRFIPDIAIADVAYEVNSPSLKQLFETAAAALTEVMVDRKGVRPSTKKEIRVSAEDPDRLLYDFLTEIIILKDVDGLLFKKFRVSLEGQRRLLCKAEGETIDRERHKLRNDVKAVTMHMFGVKRVRGGWKATVVLDI